MILPKCDKCNSVNIEKTIKQVVETDQYINMSEFIDIKPVHLVYQPITFVLKCKDCSYSITYT